MTGRPARWWDRITGWPTRAEREESARQAEAGRDSGVLHGMAAAALTERVRKLRDENGFREAVERNFREKPT